MKTKTAILAGASGLTGESLLKKLLKSEKYHEVTILVRKEIELEHPKLVQKIIDFDNLESLNINAEHVFCTLGTTIKKAGSKENFRKVDFQYPTELAKKCKDTGSELFAIVTAMGANSKSKIFYNQVKGETENKLNSLDFNYLGIFRPSMLLGNREESRLGEKIGQIFMTAFKFLIPKKYQAIHVNKVANAMLKYAERPVAGLSIISSDKMIEL